MKVEKLYLYYKEFNLGELKKYSDIFFWLPNLKNIEMAEKKYEIGMKFFELPKDKKIYNSVPNHFDEFLNASEREDLAKKANLLEEDDEFSKLFKLASLKYCNKDFIIKTI